MGPGEAVRGGQGLGSLESISSWMPLGTHDWYAFHLVHFGRLRPGRGLPANAESAESHGIRSRDSDQVEGSPIGSWPGSALGRQVARSRAPGARQPTSVQIRVAACPRWARGAASQDSSAAQRARASTSTRPNQPALRGPHWGTGQASDRSPKRSHQGARAGERRARGVA